MRRAHSTERSKPYASRNHCYPARARLHDRTLWQSDKGNHSSERKRVTRMTTIPDWLFDRTDLTFEQKWLYMALVILCESIPNKEYPTYAGTIEEIAHDTHHQGPLDPLSLFDLADKGLIRLTMTGDECAIAIAKR